MKKQLKTLKHEDTFNLSNLSCVDLIVSRLTGIIGSDNYYTYVFLKSLFYGFTQKNKRNQTLNKLGISCIPIKYYDFETTYSEIKSQIDEGNPVYALVFLNSIFYCEKYKTDSKSTHCFGITGYNEENSTVNLLEWEHIAPIIRERSSNVLASGFCIKERDLQEILDGTFSQFGHLSDTVFIYALKSVEKSSFRSSRNYINEFLRVIKENGIKGKDAVSLYLDMIADSDEVKKYNIDELNRIRREMGNTPIVLFNIFEKFVKLDTAPDEYYNEFMESKNRFISFRNKIANVIVKHLMKGDCITETDKERYINENDQCNKQLYSTIEKLITEYSFVRKSKKETMPRLKPNETNYAYKCKATSDSSMRGHGAGKAVNNLTRWRNTWLSTNESGKHRLTVDFGVIRKINKVRLYNAGVYQFNTYDYNIMGSLDGRKWTTLCSVRGNTDTVRESYFSEKECRYVKLLILKPCIGDNIARIQEFQVLYEA